MANRFVVVDVETTGNAAKDGKDKITQIAAVVIENEEICEVFTSFVNPEKPIPPFITELTGIDDDMVKNAPLFKDIAPNILTLFEDAYFVAHNVHFDLSFLQEELKAAGFPSLSCSTLDTVELSRVLMPTLDSYKLGHLANHFQFSHENPHRADSDALVTAELFLTLLHKLKQLPLVTIQKLYELSFSFKSELHEIAAAIILEKMKQHSHEDKQFDIYRNMALRKRSHSGQMEEQDNLDFQDFKAGFSQIMTKQLPRFEEREEQTMMMEEIYNAFTDNRYSLIEAGTGTGKTLAYLLPSLFFAKQKEKQIVISTQTVQLQQQILEKEIPLLKRVLPFSFDAVLLKGRKHYICLQKFEHALEEEDTNYDSILTKAKILVWLLETEAGDVDELNLPTGGKLLWERICSDRTSAVGKGNPWYERCFYQRAKHRTFFADLIITNHSLLLQDVGREDHLLSSVEYIVLDEAHHIEEVASGILGAHFSCMYFQMLLSRLGTLDTEELLFKLFEWKGSSSFGAFQVMHKLLKDIKFESDELFRMIRSFIFEQSKVKNKEDLNKLTYRFDVNKERGKLWQAIIEATSRLCHLVTKLQKLSEEQHEKLEGTYIEGSREQLLLDDFRSVIVSLTTETAALEQLLLQEQAEAVTWMELDTKGTIHSTIIYSQPIDISAQLADAFFSKKKSVVLTSATLTVNGSFQYIESILGLTDLQPSTLSISSPFDYNQQVRMMIPTDIPNIKEVSQEEYITAIGSCIVDIAKVTDGRMLVLFTSYDMLKQTYTMIKGAAALEEFAILAQGVNGGSRARLTKNFQQFDKAILFGTNSFWEGIDIPGEALTCLVMVRLPFAPPDQPVLAAKTDKIKRNGGNPFKELSLPQAIIRFKQGFGRLIRTNEDKGTFFVLDRRITATFYGKSFLRSIPSVPVYEEPLESLLELMQSSHK
ncbi:ATP-dependent DNA helicase DinG [Bacillus sp. 165]|uniref:ATP-dependent DNA helicase DinG n=1 Tax=Bacillus sp. 165 TaxID=1529117 RepID=UPI001AD95911|nr:ATP-dependent DNA helicase DinG [Bacillus sp. 165]MBO9128216.1 ATP-dependent DNA helicase DinG [Bacillus sp. 165]